MSDLTPHEAAARLDPPVSVRRLQKLLKDGRLPGARLVATPRGPVWQIPESVLTTFQRQRQPHGLRLDHQQRKGQPKPPSRPVGRPKKNLAPLEK